VILYKYLSSDRIDVFLNCKIRYTQFGDFNDPYELNPNIDRIAEDEEIINLTKKDLSRLIEQEYDRYPIVHTLISKDKFLDLAQSQEDFFVQSIIALQPTISKLLPAVLQDVFNLNIGALSLSKDPKNDLMWSHYAEEHRGYVLGFDSTHAYFNQKMSPSDELRHLRKVSYTKERPKISLMNTNGVELFLSKGINWQYELEWRIIRPLTEATEVIDKEPYPIYLFSFPPSAISEVVLGFRMLEEKKNTIRRKLSNDTEYSHIKLYQAQLNESDFTINLKQMV
jgi:hypothetical protein